jgi:hypothetical protein
MNLASASPPPDHEPGWYSDPLGSSKQRYFDGEAWTDNVHVPEAAETYSKKTAWWRPGWRKMTWVLIIWCVVMAIWLIAAAGQGDDCARETYRSACEAGSDVGKGIGVAFIWFFWFFGFLALSLIWFMTRPKGRDCPACGENVKKGRTICPGCQYDFAAAVDHEPRPA